MDDSIKTGNDHIFVGISIRKPVGRDKYGEVAHDKETPPSEKIAPNSPMPPQESGTTTTPELVVATEEQNQSEQIKCVIKGAKTDAEIPLVLETGDILVLNRLESLYPEPGGIAVIGIKGKATAIEHKDRENGEEPSAPN
jgi:hypothetical protein